MARHNPQNKIQYQISPHEEFELTSVAREAILMEAAAKTGIQWHIPERSYFHEDTEPATRDLLGCLLLRVFPSRNPREVKFCGGRIVETEAYVGEHDPAAHAARGLTRATQVLFGEAGRAYVYKIYGMHFCLNVVVKPEGEPGCVLIRAIEPLFDIEEMLLRRNLDPEKLYEIGSGPGKVCQALGIDKNLNGSDFTAGPMLILCSDQKPQAIRSGPRIGITKAADWPLRFWIDGSPWISLRSKTLKALEKK